MWSIFRRVNQKAIIWIQSHSTIYRYSGFLSHCFMFIEFNHCLTMFLLAYTLCSIQFRTQSKHISFVNRTKLKKNRTVLTTFIFWKFQIKTLFFLIFVWFSVLLLHRTKSIEFYSVLVGFSLTCIYNSKSKAFYVIYTEYSHCARS